MLSATSATRGENIMNISLPDHDYSAELTAGYVDIFGVGWHVIELRDYVQNVFWFLCYLPRYEELNYLEFTAPEEWTARIAAMSCAEYLEFLEVDRAVKRICMDAAYTA
jgi:hypothetical protein